MNEDSETDKTKTNVIPHQETSSRVSGLSNQYALPRNSDEVTKLSKALAARAEACLEVVTRFTNRLNRYHPTLGVGAPQGYMRGTWSKTDWALFLSFG